MKSKKWNYDRGSLVHSGPEIIVNVANGLDEKSENFRMFSGKLIIDTAARQTAIHPDVFEGLQLSNVINVPIRGVGYMGEHPSAVAYLTFPEFPADDSKDLPTNVALKIVSLPPGVPYFGLLGRDVLSCAEMIYNGVTGMVKLAFIGDQ